MSRRSPARYEVEQAEDGTWWVIDRQDEVGYCPNHDAFAFPESQARRVAEKCNTNPRSKPWRMLSAAPRIPKELR